jgi:hypothetical protein
MIYEESAECADCSTNPEVLALQAEDDTSDAEAEESFWLAGTHLTHNQYTEQS